jgi:hypothetical protein
VIHAALFTLIPLFGFALIFAVHASVNRPLNRKQERTHATKEIAKPDR